MVYLHEYVTSLFLHQLSDTITQITKVQTQVNVSIMYNFHVTFDRYTKCHFPNTAKKYTIVNNDHDDDDDDASQSIHIILANMVICIQMHM